MFGKKRAEESGLDEKKAEILAALRGVKDPARAEDVVTLGYVKDPTACGDTAAFTLEFATPAFPSRKALEAEAVRAVKKLPWVRTVNVKTEARIAGETRAPGEMLERVRNIVAVASGKGGVGKSTIAVNLAVGLAKAGAKAGLLDADIYGPSIPMMLGTREKPGFSEAGGKKLLVPVEKHGIRMMSMGFLVDEEKPVIWRGPMVHGAIQQFFRDVDWGDLDYLVIDLPPGTGDAQLTMVQSVPLTGAVIVTTPQDVAMIDARKAFNMFKETKVEILGIVENMSVYRCPSCGHEAHIFGEDGAKRWAEKAGVRLLGQIPLEASIRTGGDEGRPAVTRSDNPAVAAAFQAFAEEVALAVAARNEKPSAQKMLKFSV